MIIGIGGLKNDLVGHLLRAKLAEKYGLFGKVPMFGGVKLHEFYPPLVSCLLGFGIPAVFLIYSCLIFIPFYVLNGWLNSLMFLVSFLNLWIVFKCGRIPDGLGFAYILNGFCLGSFGGWVNGIFFGLGALFHPTALIFGLLLNLIRFNSLTYFTAFLVCGWWYTPFILKIKKLSFRHEKRKDKFLGIYYVSWLMMLNMAVFLFFPQYAIYWFAFTSLGYLLPLADRVPLINRLRRKIVYVPENEMGKNKLFYSLEDFILEYPGLKEIKEPIVILEDVGTESTDWGIWAASLYLLDKGVIVYNGLARTEVPSDKLEMPKDIPRIKMESLKLNVRKLSDKK